jgi:hypothetical protein
MTSGPPPLPPSLVSFAVITPIKGASGSDVTPLKIVLVLLLVLVLSLSFVRNGGRAGKKRKEERENE